MTNQQETEERFARPETGARAESARPVSRTEPRARIRQVRARHRRLDGVATFLGFAVALFFLAVLLGIVGAILGTTGYRAATGSVTALMNAPAGIAAAAGTLVATFIAYLIGGYAAGRLARYGGLDNGLGVVLWTVIVAILLGVAGAIFNGRFAVAQQFHLGVSLRDLTIAGGISVLVTLIVMILGAAAGGMLGAHYHRRIDRELGAAAT